MNRIKASSESRRVRPFALVLSVLAILFCGVAAFWLYIAYSNSVIELGPRLPRSYSIPLEEMEPDEFGLLQASLESGEISSSYCRELEKEGLAELSTLIRSGEITLSARDRREFGVDEYVINYAIPVYVGSEFDWREWSTHSSSAVPSVSEINARANDLFIQVLESKIEEIKNSQRR